MNNFTVTFENGETLESQMNGTREHVIEFYAIGKAFYLGNGGHTKTKVTSVDFHDDIGDN